MVKMGFSSRRKGCWRYRCWQSLFLALIGFPLVAAALLGFVAFFRALAAHKQNELFLHFTKNMVFDLVDRNRMMERAERLGGALKIPSVSYGFDKQEKQTFLQFHQYLEKHFPLIHNSSYITKDVVNEYSLLYTVQGSTRGKIPYLLASHFDVVPVDPKAWEVPPFSGKIVNNTYVYGRGAMDDKAGVMGIMEAVEYLLEKGIRPQRTFFLAFGHDEEISGKRGAQEIAKTLKARGIDKLEFVVDEGFPITKGVFSGTDEPVAVVGVSEKGTTNLELSVSGNPGHSSFPPSETAIGILASALARLQANPHPSLLGEGPEAATFKYLAPYVSFGYKILYNNLWLFSGLMARDMAREPLANALVRTTTAVTVFHGGIKENVVPPSATAIVNHRIHPAQTVAEVIAYDREVIADPRVQIRVKTAREAHPVSTFGPDSIPFQLVSTSIKQVFTDVIVVPGVFIANTDTRWYLGFTRDLYRFLPTIVTRTDVGRYHGNNERISVENYHQAVCFFYRIIRNADLLIDQVPSTTVNNGAEEL